MNVDAFEPLIEQGLSQREIAKRLGCSQTKVSRFMRAHGLVTDARRGPKATYPDEIVEALVPLSTSWEDLRRNVAERVGRTPGRQSIENAVARLELDTSHFVIGHPRHPVLMPAHEAPLASPTRDTGYPSKASEFYAAAWYSLAGAVISFPSEARYDLIADFGGNLVRVQVKGAHLRRRESGWEARLTSLGYSADASMTAAGRRITKHYTEDEIDEFFIVCGDGSCYRIPRAAVDGWSSVLLPGRLGSFEVERPWARENGSVVRRPTVDADDGRATWRGAGVA